MPRRPSNGSVPTQPSAAEVEHIKHLAAKMSRQHHSKKQKSLSTLINYICLFFVAAITIFGCPIEWDTVSSHHVFYYGWITAVSTGVGVIPFFFLSNPNKFWIGVSNAVAAGMMIAASYSLAVEGIVFRDADFGILSTIKRLDPNTHSFWRTLFGYTFGMLFIILTKKILDRYEDLKLEDVGGASAQKMVLIIFVMTLHSLSEGVGIGVSFGGRSGLKLGKFISISLAMHNVPEGLAVGLVMTSRNVDKLRTVLWAIFTSLPQPLFAVPAYLFVERFAPLLPAGLGFASGAMTYVAFFELLVEAAEDTSMAITSCVAAASCVAMLILQEAVKTTI